jgi:hypothetical protein
MEVTYSVVEGTTGLSMALPTAMRGASAFCDLLAQCGAGSGCPHPEFFDRSATNDHQMARDLGASHLEPLLQQRRAERDGGDKRNRWSVTLYER